MHLPRPPGHCVAVAALCLLAAPFASPQGYVAVDGSGSMAGFANVSAVRLRGTVQRLYALLSVESPSATRIAFLRERRDQGRVVNTLDERPLKSILAAIVPPENSTQGQDRVFTLNTPLQWGIAKLREQSDEFVVVTDGMETGARLGGFISDLSDMARDGWYIGVVAARFAFRGPYYMETELPLNEVLRQVRAALKSDPEVPQAANWEVFPLSREQARHDVYQFSGERPLLFLLFARSEPGFRHLFSAARGALRETGHVNPAELQIAPFRSASLTLVFASAAPERAKELEREVKLPDISKGEMDFACRVRDKSFPVQLEARATQLPDPPQPSELETVRSEVVNRPRWLLAPVQASTEHSNPGPLLKFTLRCEEPGITEFFKGPQVPRPGKLVVDVEQHWVTGGSAWWAKWDAPNSWQYPYKIYKLAEVVERVHGQALDQHRMALKRRLEFTASVRR